MNSTEFDQRFEDGESVLDALDIGAARRPRLEQRRVNFNFPLWIVDQLNQAGGSDGPGHSATSCDPVASWPATLLAAASPSPGRRAPAAATNLKAARNSTEQCRHSRLWRFFAK